MKDAIETGPMSRFAVWSANRLLRTFAPNYSHVLHRTIQSGLATWKGQVEDGHVTVELPEPDAGRDDWLDGAVHLHNASPGMVATEPDMDGTVILLSATYARRYAAALLAAAERTSHE